MKSNIKLHLLALATVFVLSFLILVPSEAFADPLTITETRISTSGSASNPDIYGGTIVWQDTRSGGNDVYMYDIPTKKETRVTTSGSAVNPAIYGNLIVWSDGRNGNGGDIYLYDLSAKKETRITTSGSSINPDIYGSKIVYENSGICLYDLSIKKITWIAKDYNSDDVNDVKKYNSNPIIDGSKIAWISTTSSGEDVYYSSENHLLAYDLSTKKEISIDTDVFFESYIHSHAIFNNKIVWVVDYRAEHEGPIIFMYDFSTKKYTQITDGSVYKDYDNLHLYNNKIVLQEDRNSPNIFMFDLSTKNETQITKSGSASNPRGYGDNIVWQDSRSGGSDIYLGAPSSSNTLAADFSGSPTSGNAPLTVNFTDTSTGSPISWLWTFGDGTSSTLQNPEHKFTKSGKYCVTLRIWNKSTMSKVIKNNYITVAGPIADFSASPTYGKAPLTVNFKDNSTGLPTSWLWTFGDGTSSKLQNPVHKYAKYGNYSVTLRVWSGSAMSRITKTNYVSVISPPVASFYATPIAGKAPLTVKFLDRSTGLPNKWYWDFGDGSNSTQQYPTHNYTVGGYRKYYTVTLTVQNEAGNNTKKISNYIRVNN